MTEYKPIEEMSFREGMRELDTIAAQLDGNTLELEESLESFERGVKLLRSLRSTITGVQQRVDVLMGELEAEPSDAVQDTTLS